MKFCGHPVGDTEVTISQKRMRICLVLFSLACVFFTNVFGDSHLDAITDEKMDEMIDGMNTLVDAYNTFLNNYKDSILQKTLDDKKEEEKKNIARRQKKKRMRMRMRM